jgi:hypothetical protein
LFELLAGATQSDFDRVGRHAEHGGGFGGGLVFEVAEHDGFARFLGQAGDGVADVLGLFGFERRGVGGRRGVLWLAAGSGGK